MSRKIRMGMVGGGRGAFIGGVHRMAAALDGEIELVCGAFSSNAEKSKLSGKDLFLPPERVYGSYEEMIKKEKQLPEGKRMDFITIVTPKPCPLRPCENGLAKWLSRNMRQASCLLYERSERPGKIS